MDRRHDYTTAADDNQLSSNLVSLDRTSILENDMAAFQSAESEIDVLNGLLGLGATEVSLNATLLESCLD